MAEAKLAGPRQLEAADELRVERNGLRLSFYRVGGSLMTGSFLPSDAPSFVPPAEGIEYCREQEILLTGAGPDFPARSRSLGGCGAKLKFLGMDERDGQSGRSGGGFTLRYERADMGLRVRSHYEFPPGDIPVVRRWVEVENAGGEPVGLERVCSVALHHIGLSSPGRLADKIRLHIPFSSWSGEGQWRQLTLAEVGADASDSAHYRASCLGSRSSAEKAPMAVIEDIEAGMCWFWQIEHSGSWMWETGHLYVGSQHGLYLVAGGPDEEHGHWWKNLQPGETFHSVPVSIGCVRGGFTEAVQALTRHRRAACRRPHPVDDGLPVIFNDYMNCLWGNPTLEAELPLIEAAADAGCEVFCMDSGWYGGPAEHWWPGVGAWEPNRERFPSDAFERIFACIRERGMIPGIWLEAEAVGVESPIAHTAPEDWFLHRHERRIQYNRRYFWNLRHPEVIAHLDGIVDRLVETIGVGYIKNDYNIDLLQGAEDGADSFGDGLLQHTLALYRWIEAIHQRHPRLIWENCAAGGLRCDYGILSHAQIQSSSDQESCADYARMVGANLALVLPEQCATWCYPLQKDSLETVVMNVINALVCRIHLSGELADLSPDALALVKSGIEVYKNHRAFLRQALPLFPGGRPSPTADADFHTVALIGDAASLLTVWKLTEAPATFTIEAGQVRQANFGTVEVVYPAAAALPTNCRVEGRTLTIDFPKGQSGRLLRISKDI